MFPGTRSNSFLSTAGLLGVSLLAHGAAFYALEPLGRWNETMVVELQKQKALQRQEKLEFEFVEAPAKKYPQSPSRAAKKISNRDALNQDLTKDKSKAEGLPAIKNVELTDQLKQKQFQPPKNPSIESQPSNRHPEPFNHTQGKLREGSQKKDSSATEPVLSAVEGSPQNDEMYTPHTDTKPLSEAQAPLQSLTGQDKITTQEMARNRSSGAKLDGFTSFEATGSGMGEYMKNLKEKIWLAWYPYLAFKYPQDYRGADALVSVLLDKKGEVKIVRILEERGSPLFAAFCMESIQRASGFGALPEEIIALVGKDELEIKFRFRYY